MNGSHYNCCWLIHEALAQALELLLQKKYLEALLSEKNMLVFVMFYNALMMEKSKGTSVVLNHIL